MTRAVVNFYPLAGEGHRKTCHKIGGCSKSRPVISPVDSVRNSKFFFRAAISDLRLSFSFLSELTFGLGIIRGKNCINAERSDIRPHTPLAR